MMIKQPALLVFAGPNGSGKSTVTPYFDIIGEYSNADDVVKLTGMSNFDAAQYVDDQRYDFIHLHKDFTFETVLSSAYKLDILKKAKQEGYFIKCVFVLTNDPKVNKDRVESRVSKGGHDVPLDKIVKRYYKSLANIKQLIGLCDILHVYDNTKEPL